MQAGGCCRFNVWFDTQVGLLSQWRRAFVSCGVLGDFSLYVLHCPPRNRQVKEDHEGTISSYPPTRRILEDASQALTNREQRISQLIEATSPSRATTFWRQYASMRGIGYWKVGRQDEYENGICIAFS
jgi:hypothetical protein